MSWKSSHDMLVELRRQKTHGEIAELLSVNERTVRRWENHETNCPSYLGDAIRMHLDTAPRGGSFRFADLFAGIGGTRLGFEAAGGRCVFTSEWDPFAQQTYAANFGHDDEHVFAGDITKVDAAEVPGHDVLLAGFPCQPFSIAGVSKKNAWDGLMGSRTQRRHLVLRRRTDHRCQAPTRVHAGEREEPGLPRQRQHVQGD